MIALRRFEQKFMPEPNSGCWLWDAGHFHDGYGSFSFRGKKQYAHRVAWELFCGEDPGSRHVLHKCDVRSCVNPDHLWLGQNIDNVRDKMQKGRQQRGENHGISVLTLEEVLTIKALMKQGFGTSETARFYGVSVSTIHDIKAGKTWGWVSP